MSMRYKGSRLSATANTPTSLTASGAWTLQQQMQANGTSTWPFVRDPQFNYVTMLLHGDGSAGANNGSGGGVTPTVTNFNADASSNNFNVTINGDARSNNFTPYQAGYYSGNFDGSGDYLSVTSATQFDFGSGDFTLECWVFCNNFASDYRFIAKVANIGSFGSWQVLVDTSGYPRFYASSAASSWDVASNVGGGVVITANTWNHVAVTRSGTTFTIWVNGVSAGTTTSSASLYYSAAVPVTVGGMPDGTRSILGNISNARVVKGTAVYTSAFTPSTTPLTAITNTSLLTCQSNRFIDNSGNTFTITVNGNTAVSPAIPFTLPSSVATYGSGYFDGTGDYLSLTPTSALNLSTNNWTIEMWVNLNTVSATQVLINFGYEGSTQRSFILYLTSSNVLQFAYSTNGSNNTDTSLGASGITTGTWNHLAVVRNSTTITVYRNGVAYGTTITIGASAINYTPGAFRIGVDATNYTNGYITDCRLVNGTAVYTSAFTPPTSPLTAITNTSLLTTQYNGGGNNSGFKDSSQNNFTITRNGNTTQGTFTPYGANWSNNFVSSATTYLVTPSSSNLALGTGDFTVETWVNFSNLTVGGNGIFQFSTSTSLPSNVNSLAVGASTTSSAGWQIYANNSQNNATATVVTGTWYHVAIVRSSGVTKLYINGTSVITQTDTKDYTQTYLIIGGFYSNTYLMDGYISNLRVIKGTALYTTAFTPSTTPLTAISGTSLLTCADNRFIDDSTNNFTVTANGTPSVQRFSPFANATAYNPATNGGSGYFDGTGDYLTTASSSAFGMGTGDFIIESWVYCTSLGATQTINDARTSNTASAYVFAVFSSGALNFYDGPNNTDRTSASGLISLNTWNHVLASRSGTTLKLFVNGAVVSTFTGISSDFGSSQSCTVGRQVSGSGQFNGYITDLRILKGTAVTTAFTPPTAPLTPTANTSLLLSNTNSAILDDAMMNDLETVGNAQISTSVVKYGTASMYFDGTGDYLTSIATPNIELGAGDYTIECWVNISAAASYGTIIAKGPASTVNSTFWSLEFSATANAISYFVYSANSSAYIISGTSNIKTSTWIHLAVCRSGNNTRLFVNGTQEGSTYTSGYTIGIGNSLFIASSNIDTTRTITGYIDDLRITKAARYTTTFTPPTQALPNG